MICLASPVRHSKNVNIDSMQQHKHQADVKLALKQKISFHFQTLRLHLLP